MKKFIIIERFRNKCALNNGNEEPDEKRFNFDLPLEKTAKAIMLAKGYSDYIAKHGYHFTEDLAYLASKNMVNYNGLTHTWTCAQVADSIKSLYPMFANKNKCSTGDLCYLANMAYADGLYEGLQNEESLCIKYAVKIADDVDGYEGIAFTRWIADIIGKETVDIDWKKYIK